MRSHHPETDSLQRLIHPTSGTDGSAPSAPKAPQKIAIVRHALTGCEPCREAAGALWARGIPESTAAARSAYEEEFAPLATEAVALETRLERERQEAPGLFAELKDVAQGRRELLIQNTDRYHTWGLVEHLLKECEELRFDAPQKSLDLARLAACTADVLGAPYPEALLEDLRGRAWAYTGNSLRILDWVGAREAFLRAHRHLEAGTDDPLERAALLSFESSLHSQRGDFEKSLELLAIVLRIYRRFGDAHQVGRTLIQTGLNTGYLADYEQAIRLLSLGLQRIDSEREPSLVLTARHNLVYNLNEAGRTRQAETLLSTTRPMYEEMGDDLLLTRLSWLEGQIALSLGNLEEAENHLIRARDGLLNHGIGLDAAMVSLDLARVLVLERRNAELRQLALEMIPIFETREVHREAFAAFILFRKAVESEAATLGLVKELARALKQEAANPTLRLQRLEGRSRS